MYFGKDKLVAVRSLSIGLLCDWGLVGLLSALLALSLVGQVFPLEAGSLDDAGLRVKFINDQLTVQALNQPTATVLRKVAHDAGITIVVYGELASTISIEFEKLPLDEALRRLLGQYNLVLLYKKLDETTNSLRKARLIEAQIHIGSGVTVPTMEFPAGKVIARTGLAGKRVDRKRKRNRTRKNEKSAQGAYENDAEILARLKTAAFDADPTVRSDALDDLSLLDNERAAVDILERVLREDPDPEVRANAIGGLEDLEQVPVEPVLDAVLFDEAPEVRIGAMEIIGAQEWKDQRTVDALSRVLDDPNEDIRLVALEMLGELGERTVLEGVARSNPHEDIRELAAELLTVLKP